jgi:hypothetical protein
MLNKILIVCGIATLIVLPQYTFASNISAERRAYFLSYLTQLMQQVAELRVQLEQMRSAKDSAITSGFEIIQPDTGDEYSWGETLKIRWEPNKIGVSTIKIVKDGRDESMVIYGQKVHGGSVNTSGKFQYKLSNFYGDGDYRVELTTESGDVYESENFSVSTEKKESLEITSPKRGGEYELIDTVRFRWKPSNPGVSNITLISTNGDVVLNIYGQKVFGNSVNTKGYFNYKLTGTVEPGRYYAKFETPEGAVATSEVFTIKQQDLRVESPKYGDQYDLTGTIRFGWSPNKTNVKEIRMIEVGGDKKWVVYAEKVFGSPTNTLGYFNYKLSGMIDPGQYYTQLVTEEGKVVEGDMFTIKPNEPKPNESLQDAIKNLQDRLQYLLNNS